MKPQWEKIKATLRNIHPILEQDYKTTTRIYLTRDADGRGNCTERSGSLRLDLLYTGAAVLLVGIFFFLLFGRTKGEFLEKRH